MNLAVTDRAPEPGPAGLFDSHSHLAHKRFDPDRDLVIGAFRKEGLSGAIEVAYEPEMWDASAALAATYPFIHLAAGVHPHEADRLRDFDPELLVRFAAGHKLCAVGETGLDYFRDYSDRANQQALFIKQLDAASRLGLPVIFHVRDAFDDFLSIARKTNVAGVVHSFSAGPDEMRRALDAGYYIGINCIYGYVSDKTGFAAAVRLVPRDRILLETDCPFLPPPDQRGRRNSPWNVRYAADFVSEVSGIPRAALLLAVRENLKALFRIDAGA